MVCNVRAEIPFVALLAIDLLLAGNRNNAFLCFLFYSSC